MFGVDATVTAGLDPAKAESAIDGVLSALSEKGPTAAELKRATRRIRVMILSDLQRRDGRGGESGRAGSLQRLNHSLGDPGKLGEYVARVDAVSAEDVKRAMKAYLGRSARVVVTTKPVPASTTTSPGKGGGR
jgi:predicted Zn-dependent peptidase